MPRQCRMQLVVIGTSRRLCRTDGTPVSDVCCWHLADIGADAEHVRSWG